MRIASAAFSVASGGTFWTTLKKTYLRMTVNGRRAERPRRLDERLLPDRDRVVADDAEVQRHVDDRDRDRRGEDPLPDLVGEQERDHDREQEEREHEQRVHDQHEERDRATRRSSRRAGRAGRRSRSRRSATRITTLSSVCVPQTIRESTSVDWTFVPISGRTTVRASCGNRCPFARNGVEVVRRDHRAKSATRTNASVIPAPIQSIARAMPARLRDRAERPPGAGEPTRPGRGRARRLAPVSPVSTGSSGRCTR